MNEGRESPTEVVRPWQERLAAAPISWGACEVPALATHGYDGWLVLEQDAAITADEPTALGGPMRDASVPELLAGDFDAVAICTAAESHAELMIAAAHAREGDLLREARVAGPR